MTEVRMPKLGVSMDDGAVTEWLVADGDTVTEGQPIYSLETDKTQTEIESPATGRIRLIAATDTNYPVGELLAEIE